MNRKAIEALSLADLWQLHEEISALLVDKIGAEKEELDKRLARLSRGVASSVPAPKRGKAEKGRRPYPRVLPKYINPEVPAQTWSGRGKTPRWLTAQMKIGKKLEDFQIESDGSQTCAEADVRIAED